MSESYQQQLNEKVKRIQSQFAEFNAPPLEVFSSPAQSYRMRAEFRIWHSDHDLFYAMFERDHEQKKVVKRIDQFPVACHAINQLMPKLLAAIKLEQELAHRLFEIDFLSTQKGEMLVSLIYHHHLTPAWQDKAQQLATALDIKIIGRSRGQKIVLSDDYVLEHMQVKQQCYIYKQIENGFSQPNAAVCEKMLNWACDVAQHSHGDLLELYCGNGNFTLPLSRCYPKVLATEIAKTSVHAAEWNIEKNQIDNIQIARLSAEEFTQAYQGQREFRRLKEQQIELKDYQFSTVLVDPPRAGIDDETLQLLAQFQQIIYISCNPDTLYENLNTLSQSHRIQRFALFDQFPYTHHVESGVLLERR